MLIDLMSKGNGREAIRLSYYLKTGIFHIPVFLICFDKYTLLIPSAFFGIQGMYRVTLPKFFGVSIHDG